MIQRVAPAGVRERWQPELDRIAPRTARGYSHLRLVWEPGEEWAPVERWTIWECMRPERAYLGIAQDLRGPPPRMFGRYDLALGRFVRTRSFMVNQRQWELHREVGVFGRPIWIVQGENGGHKRSWSDVEQNLIMLRTGTTEPLEPPAPGELPYAEPDPRTIRLLGGLDRVRKWGGLLHLASHDDMLRQRLDAREREIAQAMAEQIWQWLHAQVEETMQLTRRMVADVWDNASADLPVPDYDAEHEDFVTEVADAAGF